MNANHDYKLKENKSGRDGVVGGLLLVTIGLILLLGQFANIRIGPWAGVLVLPLIGAVFMLVGIIGRNVGLMIPGGIIGGVGLGAILNENSFGWGFLPAFEDGAWFMFGFAVGWASITLFSALFSDKTHWWPLILTAIFSLIGVGLAFGGAFLTVLTWVGRLWPLALIALGAWILLRGRREEPV